MNRIIKTLIMTAIPVCLIISLTSSVSHALDLGTTNIPLGSEDVCTTKEKERGTISIVGEAKEYFPPDVVVISLAVETTEKTAGEASRQNSAKAERVVKALKLLINPDKTDSIKTSSFTIQPVYEYDNVGKKNVLRGYRTRHQVTVRTGKIEASGLIIDSAIQNGANEVAGLNFALTDTKEYCEEVYRRAADRAKKEAAFVARTLGTKVSKIKSVAPSCGTGAPHQIYRPAMMEARAMSDGTTIEAGDIAVNASVNIVFYIEEE